MTCPYIDISTSDNAFPKTLVVRNNPKGMIWQIYHVRNTREACGLATNARSNAFYGITLEDYQPDYAETWPGWRLDSTPDIVGEDYVPTEQDRADYEAYRIARKAENDYYDNNY